MIVDSPCRKRQLLHFVIFILGIISLWTACESQPSVPINRNPTPNSAEPGESIVAEIRMHTEQGTPESIIQALGIIRSNDVDNTEFGRMMNAVNISVLRLVYPAVQTQLPLFDPPLTHLYTRILREASNGVYIPPQPDSTDVLEHILPFLAYYPQTVSTPPNTATRTKSLTPEHFLSALPDLQKAVTLNENSGLAAYFIGIALEQAGYSKEAFAQFTQVHERFPDSYPAALALARIMNNQGEKEAAVRLLSQTLTRFPDNANIKRQLARVYYNAGDWSRAEPAVAEILQQALLDREFVLMMAHILVEQGRFQAAQTYLNTFQSLEPTNKLYLFLRARVQAEGFNNRDSAINFLRAILRNPSSTNSTIDDQAAHYAVKLLLESPRPLDRQEGREVLARLMAAPSPQLEIVSLALDEAIREEDWVLARTYLNQILNRRRSPLDLLAAYTLERAQGNNAAALAFARELTQRYPADTEGSIALITALIDTGRRNEAAQQLERRINIAPSGILKSRYLFLRSRIAANEQAAVNDLAASLFEDARNLSSLIAMFEIYHRRRDERRAVYYLRQALAIAPEDPRLHRYETEYADALGRGF